MQARKAVGTAKPRGGSRASTARSEALRPELQGVEKQLARESKRNCTPSSLGYPNLLHASVPEGADNGECRTASLARTPDDSPRTKIT